MELIRKYETPAVTALEYNELRDWRKHPEKAGYYSTLIKERCGHGPKAKAKKQRGLG